MNKQPNAADGVMGIALILLLVVLVFSMIASMVGCDISGPRGNGTTSCKNCGAEERLYSGLCDSCYDSFSDWREKNGYK